MGIYTGKNLKKDEKVNFPEIVVPLLFREWGEHTEGYSDGTLWDRYIWEGSVVDLETYVDTDLEMSRAGFIPGIGCTVSKHFVKRRLDNNDKERKGSSSIQHLTH